ncbi:unnamed protein product [Arctia plantaginis]|uniref:Uncharacterized protein n=1 Tax=Arctia plantaginis TaxID=874455 RepID=A0A8S0ZNG5_ARCPL|nr:unnamed protein product [Arctia plantaginis]
MCGRMPYIWTFSPDSKPLLEQCLNAAAMLPPDNNNKWLLRFGPKNLDLIKKTDDIDLTEDFPELDITDRPAENQENIQKLVEVLIDPDFDIVSKFHLIYEKCKEKPKLLTKLAENLPSDIIEKLTYHIFDTTNKSNQFLQYFYEYFVPVYIKKSNSRLCTELLLKANKLHTDCFKILLKVILKDTDIQNTIINDFICTLNVDQQTKLLTDINNIELSGEEFSHNVFNIYTAYKSCNKTENIQNTILSLLKTHSVHCSADKSYGKLLLAYLQQEKIFKTNSNYVEIEKIIEIHKSPFKRPCHSVLEEINNSL